MRRRATVDEQLSLLDWEPPQAVTRFEERVIRGSTFEGRLARAIAVSLESCGRSRYEIADRMSTIIGRSISVNILNAYSSPQRESHQISVPRFHALAEATGDVRLIQFIAEPHGLVAVDKSYIKMIELAAIEERRREMAARAQMLRREVRRGGR
jgi:hypothetical protein